MFEGRSAAQTAQLRLDHCPQTSWRVVAKFYYATWLAFEAYDHASSDLGCWNCHYLFDFLMIWARSDWRTRGTCKGRSLAARTRHCPANRLHKTERASLASDPQRSSTLLARSQEEPTYLFQLTSPRPESSSLLRTNRVALWDCII